MLIAYGAGHGGFGVTPGKRSPSGEYEWNFNDEVARAFESQMKTYKNVELVRTDDRTGKTDIPLRTRTNKANSANADLYISFHHNAFQSKWGNHGGTETFYHAGSAEGKKLAQMVQNAQIKAYGLTDRGIKTANLHITRETRMTAVLLEGGFMDSNIDIKKLRDKKVLQKAGKEVADAVAKYLGLSKGSGSTSKPSQPTTPSRPSKPSKPSKKTIKQLATEVINGDWGTGADRKKRLSDAGYDYSKVQAEVNKRLGGGSSASKPKPSTPKTVKVGDKVKIKSSAKNYSRTTTAIPSSWKNKNVTVQQVAKNDVLIKEVYSWIKKSDLVGGSTTSKPSKPKTIKAGSTVTLKKSAKKFTTGENIASHAKGKKYTVHQVSGNKVLLKSGGNFIGWVRKADVK